MLAEISESLSSRRMERRDQAAALLGESGAAAAASPGLRQQRRPGSRLLTALSPSHTAL